MPAEAKVGVVMGSDSDWPVMQETVAVLDEFGISREVKILSAHRSPALTRRYAEGARKRGLKVIIAAAGGAAHLAGVIASHTVLPVIGVPLEAGGLKGIDALLSTVQMPAGVPVATMAIGRPGARNAALLAVQILAVNEPKLGTELEKHKRRLAESVREKNRKPEPGRK